MRTKSRAIVFKVRCGAACAFLGIFLVWPNSGQAQVVALSNLSNPNDGSFAAQDVNLGGTRSGADIAQSFTTGSAANLASVTLAMNGFNPSAGGGFHVSIFDDASGLPGSLLATLVGSSSPDTAGEYSYTDSQSTPLSGSTTYWVVAWVDHTAPDKGYAWTYTDTTQTTGSPGWSMGQVALRSVNDGTPSSWGIQGSWNQQMSISVVPEPAETSLVMGVAAWVFLLWRRMRARG